MALQITNLKELNPERTAELLALFTQIVSERHPEIEVARGVFHDLVLYFNSALNSAVQENISRVLQSNSLLSITENPAIADDAIVDKVLSNYNVARFTGTAATGEALVIVNQLATTVVSTSITFAANGVLFRPTRVFTGIPPGTAAASPGDRTLVAVGNGVYAFTITLRATSIGAAGNITRGTILIPDAAPSNVNRVVVATDFASGADALTNEEYIAKLATGLAAKNVGGRKSYSALISAQEEFKNILHMSVVGFGDAEQKRDQHSLIPVSGGGRADIYVQTRDTAQKIESLLTAVYVGPADVNDVNAGTVWQIIISKDVAPGFYDVYRVAKIGELASSGYEVTTYNRGYSFSGIEYTPDVVNNDESEFTRYKTATIRFIDTDKPAINLTPGTSAATYSVTLRAMPLIGALQDFMSSRDVRPTGADVLVKAAVPCFTAINFKILKKANEPDPNFAAIKKEIVAAVAAIGFGGSLHSSTIAMAAHKHLIGSQAVGKIDMFGKILRPDGRVSYLRDYSKLEIPNDPERMVSAKTTVFLTSIEDISVTSEVVAGFNA